MLKESQIYKNYMTNEDGTHIINVKTGKKFEPYMSNSGYYYVAGIPVHRIVASAFKYDSYFKKATVDHIDGDKLNNHVSNLEWVSQSENEKRSYQNGRQGAWTDKNKIYPVEGRIKQSQKIKGANNPASKKRIILCDDGSEILCNTREEIIRAIENKYGVKYSISYIKCLLKTKRDKKLGFNIIEGQSTIETAVETTDKGVE